VAKIDSVTSAMTAVLSASVVCGDSYYAAWTNVPASAGILRASLSTGEMVYNTGVSGSNYHQIACTENEDTIMVVKSMAGTPATFSLQKYNFPDNSEVEIASLPFSSFPGRDNIFGFTSDGKSLFAHFPNSIDPTKMTTGTLYVVDTTANQTIQKFDYPKRVGEVYDVYPGKSSSDDFVASFKSSFTKAHLCQMSFQGSTLKKGACEKAGYLNAGSAPKPVCSDGQAYAMPHNIGTGPGSTQPLTQFDPQTGKYTTLVDLSSVIPLNFLGSVACGY